MKEAHGVIILESTEEALRDREAFIEAVKRTGARAVVVGNLVPKIDYLPLEPLKFVDTETRPLIDLGSCVKLYANGVEIKGVSHVAYDTHEYGTDKRLRNKRKRRSRTRRGK